MGTDVAKSLGYAKPYDAIKTNVNDEDTIITGVSDANNHTQQMIAINKGKETFRLLIGGVTK